MAFTPQPRWWSVLAMAGLAAAVILTFGAAIQGGFVGIDDGNNIFLNPQMGGLSWERVGWAFGDFGSARRYLPLGWLGFSVVFTWQGLEPAGYHAASLGWHLLATVGLFATARNILGLDKAVVRSGWTNLMAAMVAAAWALHPMRTEAVAWASGLLYTQASAGAMIAVWWWTLRWKFPGNTRWLEAGSCLALAASLLTYPIALGLPVVCWLLDLAAGNSIPASTQSRGLLTRYRPGPGVLGLVVVAALVLAANLFARGKNTEDFAAAATLPDFGLLERGWQALYVWGRYLVQLVWPVGLSPVYTDLYSLQPVEPGVRLTASLSVGVLVVTAWLVWRRRISPGPVIAYSIMALPFLGLLEHPWIAQDRYAMLLHPVWLIAGAGWLLRVKIPRLRLAVSFVLLGLIVAGAFSARALVGVWQNPWTVHERLQQVLPRNAWAGYYLGSVPASVLFLEGRFAEIGAQLDRAEGLAPGWSASIIRQEYEGRIRQHEEFLRLNWPGRPLAPLAVLHFLHGKSAQDRRDWVTARAHFQAALTTAPDFREARKEIAWCERQLSPLAQK